MDAPNQVELSCGTIDYIDTNGPGPIILLLHGLAMDYSLWRDVIADLRRDHRCIAPTLPAGAHRYPVAQDFELTPQSLCDLIGELIDALRLKDVTLVENDSGRAQGFAGQHPDRIARLVLVACEAFDNYPPGLPGKLIGRLSQLPGTIWVLAQIARFRSLLNSPLFFGLMTKRGVPDDMLKRWTDPMIADPRIRRDFERYCRVSVHYDMQAASESLRAFGKPTLIVWSPEDRVMPPAHARRFLEVLPDARLVEIADSLTLIPIDQPAALASTIRFFVAEAVGRASVHA